MTTTTIAAEAFTSKLSPAESIIAALRFLDVELVREGDGLRATGETSNIDPVLRRRIEQYKEELKTLIGEGDQILDKASKHLEGATSWIEVEEAIAKVIDAFDGKLIGYESVEEFSRQAQARARLIPAAGAVLQPTP